MVRCTPWLSPTPLLPIPLSLIPQLLCIRFFYILQNFIWEDHQPPPPLIEVTFHSNPSKFHENWLKIQFPDKVDVFSPHLHFLKYTKGKLAAIILGETLQQYNKLAVRVYIAPCYLQLIGPNKFRKYCLHHNLDFLTGN